MKDNLEEGDDSATRAIFNSYDGLDRVDEGHTIETCPVFGGCADCRATRFADAHPDDPEPPGYDFDESDTQDSNLFDGMLGSAPAAFNRAVNETLDLARSVSDERGDEYGDTWALENQFTPFGDHVDSLAAPPNLDKEFARLNMVAALIDVKISRMRGPWQADTVNDLINYLAAFRTWRDDFEAPGGF
jgi:hypothetical protein